jgi:hypothetical protein
MVGGAMSRPTFSDPAESFAPLPPRRLIALRHGGHARTAMAALAREFVG